MLCEVQWDSNFSCAGFFRITQKQTTTKKLSASDVQRLKSTYHGLDRFQTPKYFSECESPSITTIRMTDAEEEQQS